MSYIKTEYHHLTFLIFLIMQADIIIFCYKLTEELRNILIPIHYPINLLNHF